MEPASLPKTSPAAEQLSQLREDALLSLQESQRLVDRIEALKMELSELEKQKNGKANLDVKLRSMKKQVTVLQKSEEKQLVDDRLSTQLERYAKMSCQVFCESVMSALPREIRDIIYDYVYAQDTIYVGPEYLHKASNPCEVDIGGHFWSKDYVGNGMKIEMVESWYRSTLFYFYDKANNAQVVNQFLVTDRWGLGLKPHDFICRVRFDLGASDYKLHNGNSCCVVRGLAHTLTKPLKNLHQLPNHVHFFIRIHTYRGLEFRCLEGQELRNTVEALLRDLTDLQSAGHRFVVQWSELQNLEFCSKTCGYSVDAWMKQLEDAAGRVRLG